MSAQLCTLCSYHAPLQHSYVHHNVGQGWDMYSNTSGALNAVLGLLLPVMRLPFIPVLTHVVLLDVISLKLAVGETTRSISRWINGLEREPALKHYWQGATASSAPSPRLDDQQLCNTRSFNACV